MVSATLNRMKYQLATERAVLDVEHLCGAMILCGVIGGVSTFPRHLTAEIRRDADFSAAMSKTTGPEPCTSRTSETGHIAFSSCL